MRQGTARAVLMATALVAGACRGMSGDPRIFVDNESSLVSPRRMEDFVAYADAIFIGTIRTSTTVKVRSDDVYTDKSLKRELEKWQTQVAATAVAAGDEPLPARPTEDHSYDRTTYEASVEKVYLDPYGIIQADTVSFEKVGNPADQRKPRHALRQFIDMQRGRGWEYLEWQYMPQDGERSLFVLRRDRDGIVQLESGVYDRLDVNGDKVRYYSNPQWIIQFHSRVAVPEFLADLETAVASRLSATPPTPIVTP